MHHQARIILALRLYEIEKGSLPDKLEALVPEYLPEIPEDVYSGAAMRWNPATKMVYSVGTNRTDEGGDAVTNWNGNHQDMAQLYWWQIQPGQEEESAQDFLIRPHSSQAPITSPK